MSRVPVTFLIVLALAGSAAARQREAARPAIGETVTTASGLRYVFTQQGHGPQPQAGDVMVIHGIGRFPDGKEFWNTRTDGAPYEYTPGVDRVIKGFEEAMHSVREGDRLIITMTPDLAYGERGRPEIPPNSTLVFDYEILAVKPLNIARVLRDGFAAGTVDEAIATARALPNLESYYASPGGIQALAAAANRKQAGDGDKVYAFGMTLLPDAYQLPQALGRAQAQRGAVADAIKSYETALRLNRKTTAAEKKDFDATTKALADLKAR